MDSQILTSSDEESADNQDFVQVEVDLNQDEFTTEDELMSSRQNTRDVIDTDQVNQSRQSNFLYDEHVVDSEVNFRIKRPRRLFVEKDMILTTPVNSGKIPLQGANKDSLSIEDYIQGVIDKRWKEKESELHRKIVEEMEKGNGNENGNSNCNWNTILVKVNNALNTTIKSPSDTTLYTPGLKRTPDKSDGKVNKLLIDKISDFVDSMLG